MKNLTHCLALGSLLTATTISTFALTSGEAQAIKLEGSITIEGTEFNPNITSSLDEDLVLELLNPKVVSVTDDFATGVAPDTNLLDSNATVSDINLTFLSKIGNQYNYTAQAETNSPFIDFVNTTILGEQGDLSFVLNPNEFDFHLTELASGNVNGGSGNIEGSFMFNGDTIALGNIIIGQTGAAKDFGITLNVPDLPVTDIPEPSALVGLVGVLGLGALIKKGKKSA